MQLYVAMIKKLFSWMLVAFTSSLMSFAQPNAARSVSATVVNNSLAVAAGQSGTVAINLATTTGDVSSVAFTLVFDPAVLEYTARAAGSDSTPGAVGITPNVTKKAEGKLSFIVGFNVPDDNTGQFPTFATGTKQLLVLTFKVLSTAGGSTAIRFTDELAMRSASSPAGQSLAITYTDNTSVAVGIVTSATGPTIATQPQAQTVTAGAGATFTVAANGTGPLSYQWMKGATDIAGATNASYTIAATAAADAGSYSVKVSNSVGTVTSSAAVLTVNAQQLIVTLQNTVTKTYDGTDAAVVGAGNFQVSGLLPNNSITINQTAGKFNTAVAGEGKTVSVTLATSYFVAGAGTVLANYALPPSVSAAVGVITKAPLTAKADNKTKTLNSANPSLTITYNGFVPGESRANISEPAISTAAVTGSPVGDYAITLSGGSAANYALTLQPGTLSVVAKTVPVIDWTPGAPIGYGTPLAAAQLSATAKTPAGASLPGTFVYTPANGVLLNAGEQPLSVTFTPSDTVQYAPATVSRDLTVNRKQLNLAIKGSVTKTYDGTSTAALTSGNYELTNFFGTETVTVSKTVGLFDSPAVGAGKTVSVVNLTASDFAPASGTLLANYTLPTSSSGAVGVISPKILTASVRGTVTKIYDGTSTAILASENYTLSGLVPNESVTISKTAGLYESAAAGEGRTVSVALSASDFAPASGTLLANYTLPTAASGAVGVITRKALTGSFAARNKVYDGNAGAVIEARSVSGAISGDEVNHSGGAAAFSAATVGSSKTVTLTGASLVGAKASNYTLASAGTATANITPKQLTVAGLSASNKVYDRTSSAVLAGSASLQGKIPDDDVTLLAAPTGAFPDANIGKGKPVAVTAALAGASKDNYSLADLSLAADITPKSLTLTGLSAQPKVYNGNKSAVFTGTPSIQGIISPDEVSIATTPALLVAFETTDAGTGKRVVVTWSLAGVARGNYVPTPLALSADISKAALKVTAKNETKAYGTLKTYGLYSVAFSSLGLVPGESIGGVTITSTGAPANAAGGLYDLVLSDARGGNFRKENYIITYENAKLTVVPRSVTGSFIAADKIYDGSTSAAITSRTLTGTISGDTVNLQGTATFETAGIGTGKRVVLTGPSLTGANAGNYLLASVNPAAANITAKPLSMGGLSVTSRTYDGTTVAPLTGAPVLEGKVSGEDVSLTGTPTGTFATPSAGADKAVAVGGLSLSGAARANYTLTLPSLTGTITKANQTLTIVSTLKRSATDPNFTVDVVASSKLTAFTFASSVPAVATISPSAGLIDLLTTGTTSITVSQPGNENFNPAAVSGDLRVVTSGQTLTWDAAVLNGKKFGDAPLTLSAAASSTLPVTFTSSNSAVATINGNTLTISGAGSADIIAVQAGNDSFGAAEQKATMTIAKAAATVALSAPTLSTAYNGSPKSVGVTTTPANLKVTTLYGAPTGSANAPTKAGSYVVTATIDEANYAGTASGTLVIGKASQIITFGALAAKSVSDPAFALNGSASSGLPITYASSNPLVARVSESQLTPGAAGSTKVTALQLGNENFEAAVPVVRDITINPLLPAFTIPSTSAVAIQGKNFLFGPVTLDRLSAPATFSASANLPVGLKIDPNTGNITGVPVASSDAAVAVIITATNTTGSTPKTLNLTVRPSAPVITSPAAAVATAGQLFSYVTVAIPSTGLTFAVSPLTVAGWNNLSVSATGVLTGTPVLAGNYNFKITATNSTGSANLILQVSVVLPVDAPAYVGVPNPSGTAGTIFAFTPSFGTSSQPTVYALTGDLPTGLSFNEATGAISGTTQTAGSYAITISATRGGLTSTASLTLVINSAANAPTASVTGGNVRSATVGSSFTVSISGEPTPTGFTIDVTTLPAGLAASGLNSATATISGTPTRVGTFEIPIFAQNTAGRGPATLLVLTVNPHPEAPQVVSTPFVEARVGEPLEAVILEATSAGQLIEPPAVSFAMVGTLPTGLGLEGSSGIISGTPAAGTIGLHRVIFSASKTIATIGAVSGLGLEVTINVLPPLSVPEITSNSSVVAQVGEAFNYKITATNDPTAFTTSSLPTGLSLDVATGIISGVPENETGASPIQVTLSASNGDGAGNPKTLFLTITPAPATPLITSALSVSGRVGTVFAYQITASDSPTAYVVTNLPAGLAVDVATGRITGSPKQAGSFVASVRAANAAGLGADEDLTFSINPAPSAPSVTSAPTATGEVGVALTYQIEATSTPKSFKVEGSLPPGLSLNTSTGLIKGSPVQSGTFTAQVAATGDGGTSLPQSVVFRIRPSALAPLITSPGTATGNVGSRFEYQIDGTNGPFTTRDAVNLPPGLVVNPFTGKITGSPTAVGTTIASLVATNSVSAGSIRDLTIVISPSLSAPVIFGASSVSAQVGASFSYALTASGEPVPSSYNLSGAPIWMLLNSATGIITGTPSAPGKFVVSANARSTAGVSAQFPITVLVAPAAGTPVITSSQSASGTVGVSFTQYTLASTPAASAYVAAGLPPGLSLAGASGAITGSPTQSGTFPVSISGKNAAGEGATVIVTITIAPSITFGTN